MLGTPAAVEPTGTVPGSPQGSRTRTDLTTREADLREPGRLLRPDPTPRRGVRRDAEERRERLAVPPGALGRLDELGEWLSAAQQSVPVRAVEQPRLVLFAGDHGVAELGVSGRSAGGAYELVRNVLDGRARSRCWPGGSRCRRGSWTSPLTAIRSCCPSPSCGTGCGGVRADRRRDAMTPEEAEQAIRLGMAIADEEADSGTDLVVLGDLGVGGTTAAAPTLVAALCGTDASVVTGRGGAGIDDLAWMRKCAAIRDALRRARPVLGDQVELLATSGGADLAAMTGFLLQSAVRRMPVILDGRLGGVRAGGAAGGVPGAGLVAGRSGQREPAQSKALDRMALTPLLDHRGDGGRGQRCAAGPAAGAGRGCAGRRTPGARAGEARGRGGSRGGGGVGRRRG